MTHHIKTKAHFTVRFLRKLHLVFGVKRAILYCRFNLNTRAPQMYTREVWNFQQADWSGLNTALTMAPFDVAFQLYNDIDDIVHYWVNLVKQMLKEFIPCHIVRARPKDTPWVTNQLRALIRK